MKNIEIGKDVIKKELPLIQKLPGVYRMLNGDNQILYVGKAKNLPNRLKSYLSEKLPSYAQPVFVRIIEELETTGTFKLKKNYLREEAYHLDKVKGDKVYIKKPGENIYSLLDEDYYNVIQNGGAGF